jgi:dTDP-4-dehydrorhamnose reductase
MHPVLITGASGMLGRALVRLCAERRLGHVAMTRAQLDIADPEQVAAALDRVAPWLVVNAAGDVRIDDAEVDRDRCHRDNAIGPEILARACARHGVRLIAFSTDQVFDGNKRAPYEESDRPAPLGVHARTKHEAEARVLCAHPGALVVRTSALFGPWDDRNFVTAALSELAARRAVRAAGDVVVSPTYVPDLVHACLDLAIDGEAGLWHIANVGAVTWADLATTAARLSGHESPQIEAVPAAALGWRAPRPPFSALLSGRGVLLSSWHDALSRYHAARTASTRALNPT